MALSVMEHAEYNNAGAPVFVVGHPRSGTTLVATLIGRHPNISMPPETQFFPEIYLENAAAGAELAQLALDNPRVRDLELDVDRFRADFQATDMTFKDLFELIINSYCAKIGKYRPGEKSPNHLLWAETLLDWFPAARIIGVVRDGRDVANSLMAVPWSHNNIIKHSFEWAASQELASELQRRAPENFRLIRYENLLANTEAELKEICVFLGESYHPAMLNSGSSDAIPGWEAGWKGKARREVDPSNIGKWKQRGYWDKMVMNTLMRSQLEQNGYVKGATNVMLRAVVWLVSWPYHPIFRPIFSKLKTAMLRRTPSHCGQYSLHITRQIISANASMRCNRDVKKLDEATRS